MVQGARGAASPAGAGGLPLAITWEHFLKASGAFFFSLYQSPNHP